ncbi:MAG: dipeptidase [Cyclobacteriaceae bacterium]|jgi:membrane dipeptidase
MKILKLLPLVLLWSCAPKSEPSVETVDPLLAKADSLAHQFIIVDGHVDLPYMLKEKNILINESTIDTLLSTTMGEFDFVRAKKGGLDAPFMSIYIPVKDQEAPTYGKTLADSLIDQVETIIRLLPENYAAARTPDDIIKNFKEGKISLPMGMENGAPIGKDLSNLKYFFDRGIRYITLTHNKDNQICDASNDTAHTWKGLSPFGKKVVAEMNRLGIMVDVSHVDDSTFYQVMRISKAPVIASHSSCRHFAPMVKRDLSDDMIAKMKANGGVIMINYYPNFLDSTARKLSAQLDDLLESRGLDAEDPAAEPIIKKFREENPSPVDIKTVANHIDHVVKIAGIDHVGLGSDYDGVGGNLPRGLEDVSTYPALIHELLKRGYSDSDVEKVCSGNLFRVWNKVIEVSRGQ